MWRCVVLLSQLCIGSCMAINLCASPPFCLHHTILTDCSPLCVLQGGAEEGLPGVPEQEAQHTAAAAAAAAGDVADAAGPGRPAQQQKKKGRKKQKNQPLQQQDLQTLD